MISPVTIPVLGRELLGGRVLGAAGDPGLVAAVRLIPVGETGHPPHESIREPIGETLGELVDKGIGQPVVTHQVDHSAAARAAAQLR